MHASHARNSRTSAALCARSLVPSWQGESPTTATTEDAERLVAELAKTEVAGSVGGWVGGCQQAGRQTGWVGSRPLARLAARCADELIQRASVSSFSNAFMYIGILVRPSARPFARLPASVSDCLLACLPLVSVQRRVASAVSQTERTREGREGM